MMLASCANASLASGARLATARTSRTRVLMRTSLQSILASLNAATPVDRWKRPRRAQSDSYSREELRGGIDGSSMPLSDEKIGGVEYAAEVKPLSINQGRKSLPIMPGCSMEPRAVRRDIRVRASFRDPTVLLQKSIVVLTLMYRAGWMAVGIIHAPFGTSFWL